MKICMQADGVRQEVEAVTLGDLHRAYGKPALFLHMGRVLQGGMASPLDPHLANGLVQVIPEHDDPACHSPAFRLWRLVACIPPDQWARWLSVDFGHLPPPSTVQMTPAEIEREWATFVGPGYPPPESWQDPPYQWNTRTVPWTPVYPRAAPCYREDVPSTPPSHASSRGSSTGRKSPAGIPTGAIEGPSAPSIPHPIEVPSVPIEVPSVPIEVPSAPIEVPRTDREAAWACALSMFGAGRLSRELFEQAWERHGTLDGVVDMLLGWMEQ